MAKLSNRSKAANKNNANSGDKDVKTTNNTVVEYLPNAGEAVVMERTKTTTTTTTTTRRVCLNSNQNVDQLESILKNESSSENGKSNLQRKASKNANTKHSSSDVRKSKNKAVSLPRSSNWTESDNGQIPEDDFFARPSGLITSCSPNRDESGRKLRKRRSVELKENEADVFESLKSGKSARLSDPNSSTSPPSFSSLRDNLLNQSRSKYIDDLIKEFTSDAIGCSSDSPEEENPTIQPATFGKRLSAIFEKSAEQESIQSSPNLGIKSPPKSLLAEMVANHLSENRNIQISPNKDVSIQSPFESLINQSVLQSTQLDRIPTTTDHDPKKNTRTSQNKPKPLKPRNRSSPKAKKVKKMPKKPAVIKNTAPPKSTSQVNNYNAKNNNVTASSGNNSTLQITSQSNAIVIYSPTKQKTKKRQGGPVIITKKNVEQAIGSKVNGKLDDKFQLKINPKAQFVYVPSENSNDGVDTHEADIFMALKKKRQSIFVLCE